MTTVGLILFPRLTQLDLTGPYEVFARLPDTRVRLVAATADPVRTEHGLTIAPDTTFDDCPALDVVCVPGGPGVNAMLADEAFLDFLRRAAEGAAWVTAVCTGSLLLGKAGLLRGYRATTHWRYLDLLALAGAEPVAGRVVIDRNRATGGGVTAGIDFGLALAARLRGEEVARTIQLMMEYDPAPPFPGGSPASAEPALVERVREQWRGAYDERRRLMQSGAG